MAKTKMPDPVAPCGLTLVFYYECPHCQEKIPVGAPTQPAVIRCPMCGKKFAIIPVDGYLEQYVEIMTDGGKAAANPNISDESGKRRKRTDASGVFHILADGLPHKKRMHFRTLTPDRYVFALRYNFLNQQLIQFRLLNRQRCFKGLLSQ